MTFYPWRRAKFIVEVPISGPLTDRAMKHDLEQFLRTLHTSVPDYVQLGRPRVISLGRALSAAKAQATKDSKK